MDKKIHEIYVENLFPSLNELYIYYYYKMKALILQKPK